MVYLTRKTIRYVGIGILLAVLFATSIYMVKSYGEQVRRDQAIATLPEESSSPETHTASDSQNETKPESGSATAVASSGALPESGAVLPFDAATIGVIVYALVLYARSRTYRTARALTY